ncbi:hypothetical protein [Pseudomonas typographi]|uniref:Lipoprotein n=1 Tax=Pseudomonas typographi TaxID=2715964 RepID=A0ABR7YVW3_9PSED|nr:hypothetical protein [Pseudomonas typographi]MBD1549899.1 hypothetical protein [Pseudomonas typographi]MBD1585280.1 hypothetical protein [Pseudomonas typographi]MBD1597327.1 hypothetical protein [Pseudomonas typographi]
MNKRFASFALAGLLAGCSSTPAEVPPQPTPDQSPSKGGCYQAGWQAETAPVINKRQGQEALERYDPENQAPGSGCP